MTRPFNPLQHGKLTREHLLEFLGTLAPPNPAYTTSHAQAENALLHYVYDQEIAEAYDRVPRRYSADHVAVEALEAAKRALHDAESLARQASFLDTTNDLHRFGEALALVRTALARLRP